MLTAVVALEDSRVAAEEMKRAVLEAEEARLAAKKAEDARLAVIKTGTG